MLIPRLDAAYPTCCFSRVHLEYSFTAWNAQTNKKSRLLESIQNNAARFVYKWYDWTTSIIARKYNIHRVTLHQKRNTHDLVMWYKIQFVMVNINFPSIVVLHPHDSHNQINHELSCIQVHHRVGCFGTPSICSQCYLPR